MARRTDTRKKMIKTAAALLQRQGYAATGWRQVVAESDTPWGSQSHHFPGGKEELAIEAVAKSGADYERLVHSAFESGDPAGAVKTWTELASQVLEATDWSDGCPIATVVLEQAHESAAIGDACATVFATWGTAIASGLVGVGVEDDRAETLATVVLASIEGALILARAERDRRPLIVIGDELATRLTAEVAAAPPRSG